MTSITRRHRPTSRVQGLSSSTVEAFRRRLLMARLSLTTRADGFRSAAAGDLVPTATLGHGETEGAALDRERDLIGTLMSNATASLEDIDAALRRIDGGSFGVCEDCGGSIPLERLEALPQTRHCRDCQSVREARR